MDRKIWGLAGLCGCLWLWGASGCGHPTVAFTEVKRIDERVTEHELKTFFAIVDTLPNRKIPPLPNPFLPPPAWSSNRADKVSNLLQEERKMLDDAWSAAAIARHLQRNRPLRDALRRVEMTPEQFVGYVLAIETAMTRDAVREELDLDQILKRGEAVLQRLGKDERIFSSLRDEGAFYVLQQAAWLPLVDRIQRLKQVPLENITLVRRHKERLAQIVPEEMQQDPLASLAHVLNESGLPFEELPVVGTDEHLLWNPQQAIIGDDKLATRSTPSRLKPVEEPVAAETDDAALK